MIEDIRKEIDPYDEEIWTDNFDTQDGYYASYNYGHVGYSGTSGTSEEVKVTPHYSTYVHFRLYKDYNKSYKLNSKGYGKKRH